MATLVNWNPTRELAAMQREVDRLMESFFEQPTNRPQTGLGLPMDVVEEKDRYVITAAIPGVRPDDVDITIEDNVLTVQGEAFSTYETPETEGEDTETQNEETQVRFHLRERRYGAFARRLRLPKNIDMDSVSAHQDNGVLTIYLEKQAQAQPKRIAINNSRK